MSLVQESRNFVSSLLKDKLSNPYSYHNFNHTEAVVAAVTELCDNENSSEIEKELLLVAAWFHDTGYVKNFENHEQESVAIATEFLQQHNQSESYIAQVSSLILATDKFYQPKNHLEQIIKDADYIHLITDEYFSSCEKLRSEWEQTENKTFTNVDWNKENIDFLSNKHQFYSDYAKRVWQPLKEKNIQKLKEKLRQLALVMDLDTTEDIVKKKKKKSERPERGVDTVFRVTLGNHTRLSGIADSKANILLSVNAIIISIALSTLIPKLDSARNAHLVIPTFIMLMSSVVTIIFAILSTRPKVTKGVFSRADIEDKKVNLLFFGNFYKMPIEEYEWAMNEMLKDRDYLYSTMIKDLYYLGLVLEKKYRLLRIAYNLFMIGIIISVIAFVVAFRVMSV